LAAANGALPKRNAPWSKSKGLDFSWAVDLSLLCWLAIANLASWERFGTQVDGLLESAMKARLPSYAELAKGLSPHHWSAPVDTCHYSTIQGTATRARDGAIVAVP